MAKIVDLPAEAQAEWDAWVASRPKVIQEMSQQKPPNRLYRIAAGQRVVIIAYGEDRTVRVYVSGEYNLVSFEREVFGIPFDELEECDLPDPGEKLGAILKQDTDIEAYVDMAIGKPENN